MQALYQADIRSSGAPEALEGLFAENLSSEAAEFSRLLVNGVSANIEKIDPEISKYSGDWPLSRMSVLDRNILRLAFYEIMFEKNTPHSVAASEAVNLAKAYGGPDSSKFINGILGSLIKDVKESGK